MDKYELIIIDDNVSDALFYKSLIEELDFDNLNISHVKTLSQFEKLSLRKRFHMILIDLNVPSFSYFQVLARIRELEQRSPIIILTDDKDRKVSQQSLKNGANDFMIKGIDDEKLTKKMIEFWIKFSEKVYA